MKANMERGGLVYVPSLLEAETGAMQENVVHREVLKLDALKSRRYARERASSALSLAAKKA